MRTYALLRTEPLGDDLRQVAEILAEARGLPVIDARQQVQHGRGLLAERLLPETAQRIGEALAAAGVGTFAVPDDELLPPLRPRPVTLARLRPDAFEIEDQMGRIRVEPWSELVLLALATVEAEAERRGPPRAAEPRVRAEEEEGVPREQYLDLVFDGVELHPYRIDAGLFNYQYLAADGRLSLRREENFLALVGDLVGRAGQAEVTEGVTALLAGEPPPVVPGLRLFEAELRWRLQRARALGVDRGAG